MKHCLYCGAALPASCLASPADSAAAEERLRKASEPMAASPACPASPVKDALLQGPEAAESLIGIISGILH